MIFLYKEIENSFNSIKIHKDKLLLAQDEGHLFNILNEKIVWNNNDNPSFAISKKQVGLSLLDIEEACNKFYNIINQSEEGFLKNSSEYPDFLINKKKLETPQNQISKNLTESQNNIDNEKIIKETDIISNNNNTNVKTEEKSNIDNELLCEDEVIFFFFKFNYSLILLYIYKETRKY